MEEQPWRVGSLHVEHDEGVDLPRPRPSGASVGLGGGQRRERCRSGEGAERPRRRHMPAMIQPQPFPAPWSDTAGSWRAARPEDGAFSAATDVLMPPKTTALAVRSSEQRSRAQILDFFPSPIDAESS